MIIKKLPPTKDAPMELLLTADPSKELIERYLLVGNCYVAEINEVIIGVYILLPISAELVELVNIAVVEEQQGKGIGKILVKHARNTAKKQGYQTIEVGTGNSSIHQLALYQKCGFRVKEIVHDFFIKHYEEKIFENGIQCRDMIRLYQRLNT